MPQVTKAMTTTGSLAEVAYVNFKSKLELLRTIPDANEATTRLRAIDTLLFEILGWDRAQAETEKYVRANGYADYLLGVEPSFSMLLEAKREGVNFLLSEDVPPDRPIPFDLLARESRDAADALRQATAYAVNIGVPYSAISNGHQWLLALTFVHGKPIESRSVIAFASLDYINQNFRWFWNAFSQLAVSTHAPTPHLLESRFNAPPSKLATRIANYPEPADRNVLRNDLSTTLEPLWADVTQQDGDDDFLRFCYVRPDDQSDDFELAKQMITQGQPLSASSVPTNRVTELFAEKSTLIRKPIVVLGRVGHGKSIFLQYLRRVHAVSELHNYVQIDIDFLDRPDSAAEVPEYIVRSIDRQLYHDYDIDIQSDEFARSVLNLELKRFRSSTRAKLLENDAQNLAIGEAEYLLELQRDRHTYYGLALRHLSKGQKKSLAIFFDNLDRQDVLIQEAAFLRASAIARDWDTLLFVCLRPATFQQSRTAGVLDAVAPRIITVSPPRTDVMLRRRFEYAERLAVRTLGLATSGVPQTHDATQTDNLERAKRIFAICEESFHRNKELAKLFASVSNGNARDILHYVQQVIRSGHLNTHKILAKANEGGYTIARHEALRALLFGDYKQYEPNNSPFLNLFDIDHSEPREHFSRLLALDYFARAVSGDQALGFRRRGDVESYLHALGLTGPHISNTLQALYERKCLEGRLLDVALEDAGPELRITALGRYHSADLVRSFEYLDAVVVDTPIIDDEARRQIQPCEDLRRRLERARGFLRYLNMTCPQFMYQPL